MGKAKQTSTKPTKKVIAQSIAAFIVGFATPHLQDIGASPDDVVHATALIESLVYGVVGLVFSFVVGYFKSPAPEDTVTTS